MARRIYKYPLETCDQQDIVMPFGAQIISVAVQENVVTAWALVDPYPKHPTGTRRIYMHGTGHAVPIDNVPFLGTVFQRPFVWHLFDGGWQKD